VILTTARHLQPRTFFISEDRSTESGSFEGLLVGGRGRISSPGVQAAIQFENAKGKISDIRVGRGGIKQASLQVMGDFERRNSPTLFGIVCPSFLGQHTFTNASKASLCKELRRRVILALLELSSRKSFDTRLRMPSRFCGSL
jgi:hypothetical protein